MIPTTNKAELHITYACDLACVGCNRGSNYQKPHTPNMTLEDADEFFRQADALNWKPGIIIIGGEPTLHPDFQKFCAKARAFVGSGMVQVWSNSYSPESRRQTKMAQMNHRASIVGVDTAKPNGSVVTEADREGRGWTNDAQVSPHDHGLPDRVPCFAHASIICGISVDAGGYGPCAMSGYVDGMLGLGIRTKVLADLFDPVKVAEMTRALCKHCGWRLDTQNPCPEGCDCKEVHGVKMSRTWQAAVAGRKCK